MRCTWEALHRSLMRRAESPAAHRAFRKEIQIYVMFEPFEHPVALVNYLTGTCRDLDYKDRIYKSLAWMAQTTGHMSVAMVLLWLGLWPGLDALYRRQQKGHPGEAEELVSEIWDCFAIVLDRAELSRIHRVAATLIRNTERTLRAARRKEFPERKDLIAPETSRIRSDISELGLVPGLSPEQEISRLRTVIADLVGDDADLVIRAVVYGENHRELSQLLKISHEATRQRFHRAVVRLRAHLEK